MGRVYMHTLSQLFGDAFLFLPHFLLLLLDPPLLRRYGLQVICTNRMHFKDRHQSQPKILITDWLAGVREDFLSLGHL